MKKLNLDKLNKREKILALVVGGLLLVFMFKILIFGPLVGKLSNVGQEISQTQLSIRKYLEIVERKEDILKAQEQIQRYSGLKGTDQEKMTTILSKIETVARKAGLSILDMNPQATVKTGVPPTIYRVQLRAEADMESIVDFIYNLENSDILFKIDKLDLSTRDETAKTIRIDAHILGISFT
ncbi:MAG: hypothetical protein KKC42_00365 [Candidatus Omnitrophica bacterium]|nr:hypothetical protein [Candidatus Omnitrophota bacterium]